MKVLQAGLTVCSFSSFSLLQLELELELLYTVHYNIWSNASQTTFASGLRDQIKINFCDVVLHEITIALILYLVI